MQAVEVGVIVGVAVGTGVTVLVFVFVGNGLPQGGFHKQPVGVADGPSVKVTVGVGVMVEVEVGGRDVGVARQGGLG